jgi:hypothetical protein
VLKFQGSLEKNKQESVGLDSLDIVSRMATGFVVWEAGLVVVVLTRKMIFSGKELALLKSGV